MQNFIGPLSDEAKQHAETHAANGTDPLTPEAIGAASEFYAENLAQDAQNASFTHTNQTIASHLATTNPHQITPSLIGAAAATHSHAASAITSGQLAIANGGTGASTAAQSLTNLGAAAARQVNNYNFADCSNTNRLPSGFYDISNPTNLPFSSSWVLLIQVTHNNLPHPWHGLQIVQDFWSDNFWVRRIQYSNGQTWKRLI